MRLLNPSPGEIMDRITILTLKIDAAQKREMNPAHFEAEKQMLEEKMQFWNAALRSDMAPQEIWDDIAKHTNGLIAVNNLLWAAEDDVRSTSDTEAFKLARLCKQIASWNDARAYHIGQFSALYGMQDGPEKLYKHRVVVSDTEIGQ